VDFPTCSSEEVDVGVSVSAEGREENQECEWNLLTRGKCCHSYSMLQVIISMILVKQFKEGINLFLLRTTLPQELGVAREERGVATGHSL